VVLKRLLDVSIALPLAVLTLPILVLAALAVKLSSPGPMIHWSSRVGKSNELFKMAKLRTMRIDTPNVPTHELDDPDKWFTPVGLFLRRTSIDELPQLLNVIRGEMSLVGPRPALFSQDDLVALRTQCGVHELAPGITGTAQVEGRDELAIPDKVALDKKYLETQSLWYDMALLARTVVPVLSQRAGATSS